MFLFASPYILRLLAVSLLVTIREQLDGFTLHFVLRNLRGSQSRVVKHRRWCSFWQVAARAAFICINTRNRLIMASS
jgi:hypothetical protein